MHKFIYYSVLLIFGCSLIFAQSREEKRRQEHQAVRDLQDQILPTYPVAPPSASQDNTKENLRNRLQKANAQEDRKYYYMNGNKISTNVYNYGGVAPGYDLLRGVNNFVWKNLDYVFQFCPIVGASVPSARDSSARIEIISDALWDYPNLREVNPAGDTLWQWQPLPNYADPDQPYMASNPADDLDGDGKPDSWPRAWYNPTLGKYVWPGFLSQDATNADQEVFWAMDDRANAEFPYYPFINDSSRRGIGIQIDGRAFQWSNALAENAIFFVYTITNTSDKDLDSVLFGIYGDPDLGGGSPENTDDNGFFVPPYSNDSVNVDNIPVYARSLVYFWDPDMKGRGGLPLGYLGCKFLESPGNAENGIDDDGDGMIDERQDDGIDNDGDWIADIHDVGIDGIPGTSDEGELDGLPTAGKKLPDGSPDPLFPGEPNFEFTDLDEADQIGLTSFNSWTWNADKISNDLSMWNRCIPRNFGSIQQNADIVFIFGSGYISLKKGETKRISMALLCGENLQDLLLSAETVQRIYNENYQFFKPPLTPNAYAVPDDKKVTLYWDTRAEESTDPITGNDFEGYVIYRSTDQNFNDIQTITDGKGSSFLSQPLLDLSGFEAKWDIDKIDEPYTDVNKDGKYNQGEPFVDINKDGERSTGITDIWKGYHPIPYQGRGIQYYLGDNTGLVHSFVDSNNVINGQTYYYAVVAYDHGDSIGIPPTETPKKISLDPITNQLKFDTNTMQVIPGPRASGYINPTISDNKNVVHSAGISTAQVKFSIVNELLVRDGAEYHLTFKDSLLYENNLIGRKNYSVLDNDPFTETEKLYDTNFAKLEYSNLSDDQFLKVTDGGSVEYAKDIDYMIDYSRGSIRRTGISAIPNEAIVTVTYRHYPVYESSLLDGDDSNPVFDGIKLRITDEAKLEWNQEESGWVEGNSNLAYVARLASVGQFKQLHPADYLITFSSTDIDTALILAGGLVKVPVAYKVEDVTTGVPQRILTFLSENNSSKDSAWSPGEKIIAFKPGAMGTAADTVTWEFVISNPQDSSLTPILPTDGDVILFKTKRPLTKNDAYNLKTESGRIDNSLASTGLDNIYVVPNPYVGYSEIEPTNRLPGTTRGERRIYFENLPRQCTIRIYSLSGNLVKTLYHETGVDNGREFWNLLNEDGFSVAYGIYIAHIDAPSVGEKIVKFALIK